MHTWNLQDYFDEPEEQWKDMVVEQYRAFNKLNEKEEEWVAQGPYVSTGVQDRRTPRLNGLLAGMSMAGP